MPSLQISITVLFSTDPKTPRTALSGFPATLPVFWNVSAHFFYPCTYSVDASFTRCLLNRRKLNTNWETHPPSWENGTWQVPSQLPHSDMRATNTLKLSYKNTNVIILFDILCRHLYWQDRVRIIELRHLYSQWHRFMIPRELISM